MKTLQIPYYEHPEMDYAAFSVSPDFQIQGFHKLKASFGTYIKIGSTCMFITSEDISFPTKTVSETIEEIHTGISEDTLLAALAIAQDPSLAVNLLALRQSNK